MVCRTSLIHAADRGRIDVAKVLLELEADLTHKDQNGDDAMDYAIRTGRTSMVSLLLKAGVSVQGRKLPGGVKAEIEELIRVSARKDCCRDGMCAREKTVDRVIGSRILCRLCFLPTAGAGFSKGIIIILFIQAGIRRPTKTPPDHQGSHGEHQAQALAFYDQHKRGVVMEQVSQAVICIWADAPIRGSVHIHKVQWTACA